MLDVINRIFVVFVAAVALSGMLLSLAAIAVSLGYSLEKTSFSDMDTSPSLSIAYVPSLVYPRDSPYTLNLTVLTPPIGSGDILYLEAYTGGKAVAREGCLGGEDYETRIYMGQKSMACNLALPYTYDQAREYDIYAVLHKGAQDYYAGPYPMKAVWSGYEASFWGALAVVLLGVGAIYALAVLPAGLLMFYKGMRERHSNSPREAYTLETLFNPFRNGRTLLRAFNSFLVSPYFWGMELLGIFAILAYMFISAEAWKGATALASFAVSGLAAFMIPCLWCVAVWYAEFREREPLRILVTFFLWGCLAGLMAIGINTMAGAIFELVGLGFFGAMLIAPFAEEFYKGAGLAILAEHEEYNSVEDGLVFGFVVGMGFAFIENWIYLLDNPFGGDIIGWLALFIVRSIVFSANHGVYTAIAGGVIGLLKEKSFPAPALGLIPGILIGAALHAVHNSAEFLGAAFGLGGVLAYFCLLVPLVDYGALVLLVLLFAWAVLRKMDASGKRR